ncbi:tetratricopeptide repeat protein [Corynebacterium argentoratense]
MEGVGMGEGFGSDRGRGRGDSGRGGRPWEGRGDRRDRAWGEREDRRGDGAAGRRDDRRGGRRDDARDAGRGGRFDRRGGGRRQHAQRGGADRPERRTGPQRSGFREERIMKRQNDPDIPGDISAKDLDPSVLQDLRSLSKDNADTVARHMVMAAIWMEDDPQLALRHARAAKDRAGRVSVVRETAGIAAYHAGEWKEALTELRAARRISGGPGMLAVMADCERGLGHPEKALELGRTEDLSGLDDDSRVELAIVLAGARADMGDFDSAVVELKSVGLEDTRSDITSMRLFYAFADCLVQAGRGDEAREWFLRSAELDTEGVLDARERAADLES